jgi:regulator of cell morphogenesis and NO signaling
MTVFDSTLRSIALEHPSTIRVFEHFHLDYCCGGNRPLAAACAEKGLEVSTVLAALAAATSTTAPGAQDFGRSSQAQLIRHIVDTHHAYVRAELPRLLPMAEKVAAKHGPAHPEFAEIQRQLQQLAAELTSHLHKEELILFPYIEKLEASRNDPGCAPKACFATVASPIQAMVQEHEAAGALLEDMRRATNGFVAPAWACPTVVGLLHGIDAFEKDLHRHVHLENNLLFPRAIEMERQACASQ